MQPQPFQKAVVQLDQLAKEIYATLAALFPVCLSSDEFHFFPQFRADQMDGPPWDDFSPGAVRSFLARAATWQQQLDRLRPQKPGSPVAVGIDLLSRVLTTLDEQLRLVCPQKTQPTFYLTIASIGLVEALEESREAFERRMRHLPSFLANATSNLRQVPKVFKELAVEMLPKLAAWMARLPLTGGERDSVLGALRRFREDLDRLGGQSSFRLPLDLYARIADFHMGCRMGLDEIARQLDEEIDAAANLLEASANRIVSGKTWLEVFQELPPPEAGSKDAQWLFQEGIARLRDHCLQNGLVDGHMIADCDVQIQTIPEHMTPVRANAAYSMPPGNPPKGGVFYLLPMNRQTIPRDMMLLAAHETYPGHHLLDTARWQLEKPMLRSLEFPLFYEGWACFSEEILFDTAFFSGPENQLLMAKRRFWRAHRGRAEFRLHTGKSGLDETAARLAKIGLVTPQQATAMVTRYALKPGYQLSYAIGRRKFRKLYSGCLNHGYTPAEFVRKTLTHGEIEFEHLERLLFNTK